MLKIIQERSFEKDLKALKKKHYSLERLCETVELLAKKSRLSAKYHDHALAGDMQGYRECHIERNWLLVYQTTETEIILVATGSHDDLFK